MGEARERKYHHGDLRHALLEEAERILEADGIQALTLRAAARGVGVSHTAPQNHFGDLGGLLSELAAIGHRRLAAALLAAGTVAGGDPIAGTRAWARAYFTFARSNPGMFTLMFRAEKLDRQNQALRDAVLESRRMLRQLAVGRATPEKTPRETAAIAISLWALVHGYSVLAVDGRLRAFLSAMPGEETPESFLDPVLDALQLRERPG